MESNKGTSVTRFGNGPDDEDITIHFYESLGRFEVKNKDITGPMIFATDDLLEPEVPKGARLLVNEKKTTIDENGATFSVKPTAAKALTLPLWNCSTTVPTATRTTARSRKSVPTFPGWS